MLSFYNNLVCKDQVLYSLNIQHKQIVHKSKSILSVQASKSSKRTLVAVSPRIVHFSREHLSALNNIQKNFRRGYIAVSITARRWRRYLTIYIM